MRFSHRRRLQLPAFSAATAIEGFIGPSQNFRLFLKPGWSIFSTVQVFIKFTGKGQLIIMLMTFVKLISRVSATVLKNSQFTEPTLLWRIGNALWKFKSRDLDTYAMFGHFSFMCTRRLELLTDRGKDFYEVEWQFNCHQCVHHAVAPPSLSSFKTPLLSAWEPLHWLRFPKICVSCDTNKHSCTAMISFV